MFLENSQFSEVGVSFLIRFQACNVTIKKTPTQVFSCEYSEIFTNSYFDRKPLVAVLNFLEHIFYRAPLMAASVLSNSLVLFKKTGLMNTMLLKNIYT